GDIYWYNEFGSSLMMSPASYPGIGIYQVTFNTSVLDMEVVDHVSQSTRSACSPHHPNCSQLCAPRPHATNPGSHNRTCLCGDLVEHIKQSSGDERCLCDAAERLNGSRGCVVLNRTYPNCTQHQFQCANGRCIPNTWECDFDNDCHDMSDENNCFGNLTCRSWQFQCDSGDCVTLSSKCNGIFDCSDGSDEGNCTHNCSSWQFACANGTQCIYSIWQCDGDPDCHDGSDEVNCPSTTPATYTTSSPSGACLPGTSPCGYLSNFCVNDRLFSFTSSVTRASVSRKINAVMETTSARITATSDSWCRPGEFYCYMYNETQGMGDWYWDWDASPRCIRGSWRCDGEEDCLRGEDELNCHGLTTCATTEFLCVDSGGCIPLSHRCDQTRDCDDGSDELFCGATAAPVRCDQFHDDESMCCSQASCMFLDCPHANVK
ncbi:hypothetical protein BaRGS_00035355, partial [Batillaria attramentaria]